MEHKGWGPEGWEAQNFAFFSLLPPQFSFFPPSLGVFSLNFAGALKCGRLEFSGCRVKPRKAAAHFRRWPKSNRPKSNWPKSCILFWAPPSGPPPFRPPPSSPNLFALPLCRGLGPHPSGPPLGLPTRCPLPLLTIQNVCASVCAAVAAVFHVCVAAVAVVGASFAAFADPFGAFFFFLCCCCLYNLLLLVRPLLFVFVSVVFAVFFCFCCCFMLLLLLLLLLLSAFGSPTVEHHPCRF